MLPLCSSQAIPQAIRAIRQLDEETLHQALQGLATAIGAMGKALQRMHGNSSLGQPLGGRARGCSPAALRECAGAWPREQLIKVLPVGNPMQTARSDTSDPISS